MLAPEKKAVDKLLLRIKKLREVDTEASGKELESTVQELSGYLSQLQIELNQLTARAHGSIATITTGVSKECLDGMKARRVELARERHEQDPIYREQSPEGIKERNQKMRAATKKAKGFWGTPVEDIQYGRER